MNEEERKALSINPRDSEITLRENATDRTASLLKGALGATPFIGSILQEAIGVAIPNQRIDRIALTMEIFDQKVNGIEQEVLRQKILSEEFTDLLEDAIPQSARALSDERKEYIASFLSNSVTNEELDHIHEKKILKLLGELNDAEIIFLRYESLRPHEKDEFFEQHQIVLNPVRAAINSPRFEHDRNALRSSFQDRLLELGLLRKEFAKPKSNQMPELDEKTGMLKAKYLKLTQLGRLLLRYIDQPASSDKEYDELLVQRQRNERS